MKKALFLALLGSFGLATGAVAGELSRDATIVKNRLEWAKVTSCSNAFARTLDSLVKGRQFYFNIRTNKIKPNDNPANVDFAIYGTKKQYSVTGSIQLQSAGPGECSGEYIHTTVVAGSCGNVMDLDGSAKTQWTEIFSDHNGDAAPNRVIFLENKDDSSLRAILNDVGMVTCAITWIKTLDIKN